MRVLFDTAAVSYWHGDVPSFRMALEALMHEISPKNPTLLVSSVTVQEIAVYALIHNHWADTQAFVWKHFSTLDFDQLCAIEAAKAQAALGRPERRKPKSADRAAIDTWFRDGAIVGTCIRHGVDVLVSPDSGFRSFKSSYAGNVWILEASPSAPS